MIYLMRHGETEWTLSGQHTGKTDLSLTEKGKKDAAGFKQRLEGISFDLVLTSPLKRAKETCALAGFAKVAKEESDLVEWDYGAYEGLTSGQIQQQNPGWNVFANGGPEGESPAHMQARMDRLLAKLPLNKNIALFSHGHCLRALTARYLGLPIMMGGLFSLSPSSLSTLGKEHDKPVIVLWNAV